VADWLTALSIFIATVTWLVTYVRDRHAHRVAYTVAIISNLSTSDRLAESCFQLTKLINANTQVPAEGVDPKIESHVVDVLDYYEFLSELYVSEVLNKETVENLRGRLMKRTWYICKPYIEKTREKQQREIYSCYEQFVNELHFKD
jgi:hypothetical protein